MINIYHSHACGYSDGIELTTLLIITAPWSY